jgi:archaellum component FlaC
VELEHLRTDLANAELELATLRSELIAFERRYLQIVGARYAELDRLDALIAEMVAAQHPTDPIGRENAESARTRAQESARAMEDSTAQTCGADFEPSEQLKQLYRRAALQLHPDLTTDDRQKIRRAKAMAKINSAFELGDEDRIRRVLDEWRSSPDQVEGDDTAAQLVRTIREIAQVRKRLQSIQAEVEQLTESELHRLKTQVEEATKRGRDLLAEMATQLDTKIEQATRRINQVEQERCAHES